MLQVQAVKEEPSLDKSEAVLRTMSQRFKRSYWWAEWEQARPPWDLSSLRTIWPVMRIGLLSRWMLPNPASGSWATWFCHCGIVEVRTSLWSNSFRARGSTSSRMLRYSSTYLMWPARISRDMIWRSLKIAWMLWLSCRQRQESFAWYIKWICSQKMFDSKLSSKDNKILSRKLMADSKSVASRRPSGTRPSTEPGLKSYHSCSQTSRPWRETSRHSARPSTLTKWSSSRGPPSSWSRTTMQRSTKISIGSRRSPTSSSSSSCLASKPITNLSRWSSRIKSFRHMLRGSRHRHTSWSWSVIRRSSKRPSRWTSKRQGTTSRHSWRAHTTPPSDWISCKKSLIDTYESALRFRMPVFFTLCLINIGFD